MCELGGIMTAEVDLNEKMASIEQAADPYQEFRRTGPGTLGGRLMRSFWQPIALTEELEAGRALPIKIMSEEFTLYRGETGTAHLVTARCPHRGTPLSIGYIEDDCIRCFYHGWKYDETGQCIDQAIESPMFATKVRIPSYPVYEYLGLVFTYLGEGDPPPKPYYPEFETDEVVVTANSTYNPFNFYSNMDNSLDTLHVNYVHRLSSFFAESRGAEFGDEANDAGGLEGMITEIQCEETEYGICVTNIYDTGSKRINHMEMPNILHIKIAPISGESGWLDFCSWRVPLDDEHYLGFSLTVARVQGDVAERYRSHPRNHSRQGKEYSYKVEELGDAILAGKLRLSVEDCGDYAKGVNLQDYIAQRQAAGQPERLGRSDKAVILQRNLWIREMHKIANGEPIKQWRWPGYLEPTSGVRANSK